MVANGQQIWLRDPKNTGLILTHMRICLMWPCGSFETTMRPINPHMHVLTSLLKCGLPVSAYAVFFCCCLDRVAWDDMTCYTCSLVPLKFQLWRDWTDSIHDSIYDYIWFVCAFYTVCMCIHTWSAATDINDLLGCDWRVRSLVCPVHTGWNLRVKDPNSYMTTVLSQNHGVRSASVTTP